MIIDYLKKNFKNIAWVNLPNFIELAVGLITLPIILANLNIEEYGKWQFVLALQVWLISLSGTYITKGANKGIANELNGTFLYAFLKRWRILALISLITIIGSGYYFYSNDRTTAVLIIFLALFLFFGFLFRETFLEYLVAKKRLRQWSLGKMALNSCLLISSCLVAYYTHNIFYFAITMFAAPAIVSWIAWLILFTKDHLFREYINKKIDGECYPYGIKLIPMNLISMTGERVAHFIIGPLFGFANLAVFATAVSLKEKFSALIKNIYPLFYSDFARTDKNKLIESINKYTFKIGFLGFFITGWFILASWIYVFFFLPENFKDTFFYFLILSPILPAWSMTITLNIALEAHLRYKELTIIGIISNLLKILLVLVGGLAGGVIGICIGLSFSSWLNFLLFYLFTIKIDSLVFLAENNKFFKRITKYLA